jgi:hypothetical protein
MYAVDFAAAPPFAGGGHSSRTFEHAMIVNRMMQEPSSKQVCSRCNARSASIVRFDSNDRPHRFCRSCAERTTGVSPVNPGTAEPWKLKRIRLLKLRMGLPIF